MEDDKLDEFYKIELVNPYHDKAGRFASKSGGPGVKDRGAAMTIGSKPYSGDEYKRGEELKREAINTALYGGGAGRLVKAAAGPNYAKTIDKVAIGLNVLQLAGAGIALGVVSGAFSNIAEEVGKGITVGTIKPNNPIGQDFTTAPVTDKPKPSQPKGAEINNFDIKGKPTLNVDFEKMFTDLWNKVTK